MQLCDVHEPHVPEAVQWCGNSYMLCAQTCGLNRRDTQWLHRRASVSDQYGGEVLQRHAKLPDRTVDRVQCRCAVVVGGPQKQVVHTMYVRLVSVADTYLSHRPEEDLQSPVQRDVSLPRHSCEISGLPHVQRLELVGTCAIVVMIVNKIRK